MKQNLRLLATCLGLVLLISCAPTNPIEGVWQGKERDKFSGGSYTWELTFTKAGNQYGGQLVVTDETVRGNVNILKEVKIDEQQVSFILGQTKCEGTFSGNNTRLNGKCLFNLESIPNGIQKGEEMKTFELTKK